MVGENPPATGAVDMQAKSVPVGTEAEGPLFVADQFDALAQTLLAPPVQ